MEQAPTIKKIKINYLVFPLFSLKNTFIKHSRGQALKPSQAERASHLLFFQLMVGRTGQSSEKGILMIPIVSELTHMDG